MPNASTISWKSLTFLEIPHVPNANTISLEPPTFPQLLIWERKKTPEVGNEVEKGVLKNPTQIWPYLYGIPFNTFPNLPPLRNRYVYQKWFTIPQNVGTSEFRVSSVIRLGLSFFLPLGICHSRKNERKQVKKGKIKRNRLNTKTQTWCRMALEYLGQFDKIHCEYRPHKVLWNYMLIPSGNFSNFRCVLRNY